MRSRGNIRRQFKLGVRRIIRLAPGTAAWWQQTQTALGEARYQPRRYSDRYQTWCLCCSFGSNESNNAATIKVYDVCVI